MFEFIRTHTRLMLGLMLLLIIPSFVFFGVQGYSSFTDGTGTRVAEVDGTGITRAEWDFAHRDAIEQRRRRGEPIDAAVADSPAARLASLEDLVARRSIEAAVAKAHGAPSAEAVVQSFRTDPAFASLRNADGTPNAEALARVGLTSPELEQVIRQRLAYRSVLAGASELGFVPPAVADISLDAFLQRREVQVQRFDTAAYRAQVNPSDADIEAYYNTHQARFRAAEQAKIEYVVLTLDDLMADVAVPEEDLRRYYEENASRYSVAEERRASHILVNADADQPKAERDAAKARAEALLAEVRKAPSGFAQVARKNSQDTGSAAQGGDLGYFGRGAMVKPFEDAVFAMKPGEISNVIQSDFGFHIITLTGVKGGDKKPFDAVRGEIEAEVRRSLAQRRYAEAAEQFTNTVYEQADSLDPVVEKLKLKKQTATVQRRPAAGASGALASEKLLAAVFGTDAVQNKRNTDAVEIGSNQLAAARIVEHTPARTLPLAEVKDSVREAVVAEQAAALARRAGEARLAELRKGSAQALSTAPVVVSRNDPQGLPPPALEAVLLADPTALPALTGVDLGAQGYLVARVIKVLPRQAVPEADAALQQQVAQAWSNAEARAYLTSLKQRFGATIKASAVAAIDAENTASAPGL